MEDITPLLQKGALIAQNPSQFESIKGLTDVDREVIRREITRALIPISTVLILTSANRQVGSAERFILYRDFMLNRCGCTVRFIVFLL